MIQRPTSPPALPTTSRQAPRTHLGRRFNRRKCGGGIAVCSVGVLCLMLFMAEMRTNKLAVSPSASASSNASRDEEQQPALNVVDEAGKQTPEAVPPPGDNDLSAGLRRFSNFQQYAEMAAAAEADALPTMPVVRQEGEDVTIPSFIIVGARRAGTSSLFRMLGQHPDVGSIVHERTPDDRGEFITQDPATFPKEVEWPGDRLEAGMPADKLGELLSAYARPYSFTESRSASSSPDKLVAGELGPGYLASPLAPYRLKVAIPNLKVVVVLRDPTDRYYSELRSKLCVENEDDIDWDDINDSFAMPSAAKSYLSSAVVDYSPYDKRCLGEGASAADLWKCQEAARKSHRPLLEGLYAGQIGRWLRAFDASQLIVVDSGALFVEPEKSAAEVAKFVGLEEHTFFEFAVDRQASCDPRRRSSAVASAFSKRKEAEPQIRKWFSDHNDMLAELLGKGFGWNDRIKSMKVNGAGLL